MNKNVNSTPTQLKKIKWSRNFFLDLNEIQTSRHLGSNLFRRIKDNFVQKSSKFDSTSNLIQSTPKSNYISNQSNLSSNKYKENKESLSPNDSKKSINNKNVPINIKQTVRNVKSYDFLAGNIEKNRFISLKPSDKKFSQKNIFENSLKTNLEPLKSFRVNHSKSLSRDEFMNTMSGCMELKDPDLYVLEILEKNGEDIKIQQAIQTNSFEEFNTIIQEKLGKIEKLYIENYEKSTITSNSNKIFLDLLKIFYKELMKIIKFYMTFLNQRKNSCMEIFFEKSNKNLNMKDELREFIEGFELLMKIYSPYNRENKLNLTEINADYHEKYKYVLNHFIYDTESQIFHKILSKAESHFKYFESIIETLHSENDYLNIELSNVKNFLNENIVLNKGETKQILENHLKSGFSPIKDKSQFEIINIHNDLMVTNIKKLELENEELQKQIILIRRSSVFQDDSPSNKHRKPKKTKMTDKGVQINFIDVTKNYSDLTENITLLHNIVKKSVVYYKYKEEDILSLINLICNEKLINDYYDIQENHKMQTLNAFVTKWFLIKIGNPDISNLVLRDFILNIRDNLNKNIRFTIFLQLCGINQESPEDTSSTLYSSNSDSKKNYKKIFLSSSYACKIFLKTAYILRYSTRIEDQDTYSPLFPNANSDADSQKYKILLATFREILKEEGVNDEIIEEAVKNFGKFCTKHKILNNLTNISNLSRKSSININLSNISNNASLSPARRSSTINFDMIILKYDLFMKFLLDFFADEFQQKMEHLAILLKLIENSRNQGKIFIEDFKAIIQKLIPNQTFLWVEKIYEKFIHYYNDLQIKNHNEITQLLAREILEEINYEEFYANIKTIEMNKKLENNVVAKKITIFSKNQKECPSEGPFIYNQNNPENYKIWNMFDQMKDSFSIINYDIVNSLCFINLIYEYLRDDIKNKEEKNDALYTYHEIWKREFYRLPVFQGLRKFKKYSNFFNNYDRLDLIQKIQMNWNLIKLISDAILIKN